MITIFEKEKKQRNLIFVLISLVSLTCLILYFGYFKRLEIPPIKIPVIPPPAVAEEKKIEIDFEVLKNPIFKELQVFEKIEEPKLEEIGRKNPFEPY